MTICRAVGRVGEDFLIAGHRGVEHHLAGGGCPWRRSTRREKPCRPRAQEQQVSSRQRPSDEIGPHGPRYGRISRVHPPAGRVTARPGTDGSHGSGREILRDERRARHATSTLAARRHRRQMPASEAQHVAHRVERRAAVRPASAPRAARRARNRSGRCARCVELDAARRGPRTSAGGRRRCRRRAPR